MLSISWTKVHVKHYKKNYYAPLHFLKQINLDSFDDKTKDRFLSVLPSFYRTAGDYDQALQMDISRRMNYYNPEEKRVIEDSTFLDYKPIPAKSYIPDLAKSKQVIMVNESHHTPYHRAFIYSLLGELREEGYKYLTLEALKSTHTINEKGYPSFDDGFYTKEPLFAEMMEIYP